MRAARLVMLIGVLAAPFMPHAAEASSITFTGAHWAAWRIEAGPEQTAEIDFTLEVPEGSFSFAKVWGGYVDDPALLGMWTAFPGGSIGHRRQVRTAATGYLMNEVSAGPSTSIEAHYDSQGLYPFEGFEFVLVAMVVARDAGPGSIRATFSTGSTVLGTTHGPAFWFDERDFDSAAFVAAEDPALEPATGAVHATALGGLPLEIQGRLFGEFVRHAADLLPTPTMGYRGPDGGEHRARANFLDGTPPGPYEFFIELAVSAGAAVFWGADVALP